jgi:hypothetical protein
MSLLNKMWLFLWPPIERGPFPDEIAPTADGPNFYSYEPGAEIRTMTRVPPHQRFRAMSSDERGSVWASYRSEPTPQAGRRRRAAH